MNLIKRIEKIEARLEEIAPSGERIDYPIQYKRDEFGVELYRIRKNTNWLWASRKELDEHISKYGRGDGILIFVPQRNAE